MSDWLERAEALRRAPAPFFNRASGAAVLDNGSLTIVDRDPCPRCGVRGDIGCKHRRRS